jgi:deazaflavin-dependent oxidoreductase (nitroreductase family)
MSKDYKRIRLFNKRVTNPLLRRLAYLSRGPFAIIRHVGRRSGKTYETPLMVFRTEDGFVIVLTYGPNTDWYRNIQAADRSILLWHKREFVLQRPEPIDKQMAWKALPPLVKQILRMRDTLNFVQVKILASEPAGK